MQEQNFKNHSRLVPLFHYVAFTAILFSFVLSVISFVKAVMNGSGRLHSAANVSLIIGVILVAWFARVFALKAQDRAIRAEENLRSFAATGKLLDTRLKLSQIIALRFASNEEYAALAKRAIEENLSSKEIKMAIKIGKEIITGCKK
ncbi:MAG: hypothetical protein IPP48_11005 [Chitinophagaceae bacterium]|nr:hypothetical protein [Chitinophagaceae bacterium]